jgi:hypothetical protein
MNRRQLMQSLFVAAPVAMIAHAEPSLVRAYPHIPPDKFQWHGWQISWTGWKAMYNMLGYAGQWVAFPLDKKIAPEISRYGGPPRRVDGAISSIPGNVDWYWNGYLLNIDVQEDQVFIGPDTSESIVGQQKYLALRKLIDFLRTSKVGC